MATLLTSAERAKLIAKYQRDYMNGNNSVFSTEKTLTQGLERMYREVGKEITRTMYEIRAELEKSDSFNASGIWKIERYNNLFHQVNEHLTQLGVAENKLIENNLQYIFSNEYLESIYRYAQMGYAVQPNFRMLNPNFINAAIQYPWSGKMFSDSIWADKNLLAKNLRNTMVQNMILGESMPKLADRITKNLNTTKANALRVARTETMRVSYVANRQSMKDSGIEKVKYLVALDERLCDVCGGLGAGGENKDGVYVLGEEPMLPTHPNCRCTYVAEQDDFMKNLSELKEEDFTEEQLDIMNFTSVGAWKAYAQRQYNKIKTEEQESLYNGGKRGIDANGYKYLEKVDSATRLRGDTEYRDRLVREYEEGITISMPLDLNKELQIYDFDSVMREFMKLPKNISRHVREIQLLDYANPDDAYWERTYNMLGFRSFATGGGNEIHFYNNGDMHKGYVMDELFSTLAHEAGHNYDNHISKTLGLRSFSQSYYWTGVMEEDKKFNPSSAYSSNYAKSSNAPAEDFADTISGYLTNIESFEKRFPNRTKKVRELLDEYK